MSSQTSFNKIDRSLFYLFFMTIFCLSPMGEDTAEVAMFLIIGLPVTLLIMVIPMTFFVLLLLRLTYLFLLIFNLSKNIHKVSSVIIVFGLLTLPTFLINKSFDDKAQSLISEDVDRATSLPSIDTLGYIRRSGSCDDFCQRALLNNQVKKIIVSHGPKPIFGKDWPKSDEYWPQKGKAYWFEKRDNCPAIKLNDHFRNLKLKAKDTIPKHQSPSDLIRLQISKGNCLTEAEEEFDNADAVLIYGNFNPGGADATAGLNPFADVIRASRLAFYLGEIKKRTLIFQTTEITVEKLFPIMTLTLTEYGRLQFKSAFLRQKHYFGGAARYHSGPNFGQVVENKLGFDLALHTPDKSREYIQSILQRSGEITLPELAVIEDFFENTPYNKKMSANDAELALKVLMDRRIPVPVHARKIIDNIPDKNPRLTRRFTKILFERLVEFKPDLTRKYFSRQYKRLESISNSIARLPAELIAESDTYFSILDKLANDPVARVFGYRALKHLNSFNQKGLDKLLYLIDDAEKYRSKRKPLNQWLHPYLAGMQGLCNAPHQNVDHSHLIQELYKRIDDGVIAAKYVSSLRLTINTLIALGAEPDELWKHMKPQNNNQVSNDEVRKFFDYEIGRTKKRISCRY